MAHHAPLTAKALSIGYQHKATVSTIAKALNLALHAGEFVCLLGPNGAGKSTLLRTLAGMQLPLSGNIQICDTEFSKISPRERARLISVVLTENPATGMMDARTLVSLGRHPYSGWLGGLRETDHQRIDWALSAVGANALETRQVAELSDGERQKISIARALAQEAKVMLLDEPTAFLDLPRRVELMGLLRTLAHKEQLGLLLSTHDLDLALRFADRLWILTEQGQLIQGYPEALALDGQLADAFTNENVDWDSTQGSFRAHREACLYVHMEGDSTHHTWTRRALERLGYGIASGEKESAFSIDIHRTDNSPTWTINQDGNPWTCGSIVELIDWIRNKLPS
jgi:iron complex transport system ATP-binding protein